MNKMIPPPMPQKSRSNYLVKFPMGTSIVQLYFTRRGIQIVPTSKNVQVLLNKILFHKVFFFSVWFETMLQWYSQTLFKTLNNFLETS